MSAKRGERNWPDHLRLSKRDCAIVFGVSEAAIDKWRVKGCPTEEHTGRVWLWLPEVIAWKANRDSTETDASAVQREWARLNKARAEKAELEVQRLKRELVPASDVLAEWGRMVIELRAFLLTLPPKLAPLALACDSTDEARAVIQAGVYEALSTIASDGLPRERADAGGGGQESELEDDVEP